MIHQYIVANARTYIVQLCLLSVYCISSLFTLPAYSIDTLYSLNLANNLDNQGIVASGRSVNSLTDVHIDNQLIASLDEGEMIAVPLPGGKIISGRVLTLDTHSGPSRSAALPAARRKIVSLDNHAGSVELDLVDNAVTRMLLHDVAQAKIYVAHIDSGGDGQLRVQDNNDHYCVKYPETAILAPMAHRSPQAAAAIPDVASLQNLQSRPGSANVLFIDYWGGSLTNSVWNANHTSNAPINYTAYDTDGNPGSFSSSERYSMWLAWREAVEDFAPFNINLTTSRAVYNAAAVSSRSQIIVTTTSSWYGNAGGVAYLNIFDDNSNYYKVGWTWNLSDTSMGMTIAHEAGHQMGLRHDGVGGLGYYSGHGVWGPIMGAPFGKPYVQWSKGEYPNANQNEDDIAKVSSKLGLVADDAGNGYTNATTLSLPVNNRKGLLGYQDTDAYKFTLSSASSVQIEVVPLLGDEGESRAANVALDVSLVKLNSSGGVIASVSMVSSSDTSPLSPLTNEFVYGGSIAPGTYGLRLTPSSPDTSWVTGFGGYGNAGEYRFTVTATVLNAPDLVVQPVSVNNNLLTTGQNFTISATVKNQGSAASGSSTLRYYRSSDSTINSSDTQLSTDPIPSLAANGVSMQNATVTAPNTPGNYWVGACTEIVANESNTQNNCSAAVQITVNPPAMPDLIANLLTLSAVSLTPNQSFTISATVKNQGNAASGSSTLRYYRSPDSTINSSDTQLTTDSISALAANGVSMQNATVSAPDTPGNYWIGACVDIVSSESDTQNNCSAAVQITVGPPPMPDLLINSFTLSSMSLMPGENFIISTTVKNQGDTDSDSSTLRYYLSTDWTINSSDTQLTTDFVSALTANENSAETATVSSPNSLGNYWIGACVDNVANESNLNNNCSNGIQIEVTTNPAPVAADDCTIFVIPIDNNETFVFCM